MRWICKHRVLEIADTATGSDGKRKQVDQLIRLRAEEMRAQNALGLLFNQHLEAGTGFGDAPRRLPAGRILVTQTQLKIALARGFFMQAGGRQRRYGEHHTRYPRAVRRSPLAVEQVLRNHAPVMRGNRRERRGRCDRIARSVDGRIGNTLQVLVHPYAGPAVLNASCCEIKVVNIRHAPGAVHHHLSLKRFLLSGFRDMGNEPTPHLLDSFDARLDLDTDADLAGALDESLHKIRIKAPQRPDATVQHRRVGNGAGGNVSQLERDVSTADENDVAAQAVELQRLIAEREKLLTRNFQVNWFGSGRDDNMAALKLLVFHRNCHRSDEARPTVKRFDAGLSETCFSLLRDRIREGVLEMHQLGPVTPRAGRVDCLPFHAVNPIQNVGRADEHFLRATAAQRACHRTAESR